MFPVKMLYLEDVLSKTNYEFQKFRDRRPKRDPPERRMKHEAMIEPYLRRIRNSYDSRVLDKLRLPESEGCEDIDFIADLVYYICENEPEGAILVFLPGYDKISQLYNILDKPKTSKGPKVAGSYGRISITFLNAVRGTAGSVQATTGGPA